MPILMDWDGEVPYLYYFKHGLIEEKVVSISLLAVFLQPLCMAQCRRVLCAPWLLLWNGVLCTNVPPFMGLVFKVPAFQTFTILTALLNTVSATLYDSSVASALWNVICFITRPIYISQNIQIWTFGFSLYLNWIKLTTLESKLWACQCGVNTAVLSKLWMTQSYKRKHGDRWLLWLLWFLA